MAPISNIFDGIDRVDPIYFFKKYRVENFFASTKYCHCALTNYTPKTDATDVRRNRRTSVASRRTLSDVCGSSRVRRRPSDVRRTPTARRTRPADVRRTSVGTSVVPTDVPTYVRQFRQDYISQGIIIIYSRNSSTIFVLAMRLQRSPCRRARAFHVAKRSRPLRPSALKAPLHRRLAHSRLRRWGQDSAVELQRAEARHVPRDRGTCGPPPSPQALSAPS